MAISSPLNSPFTVIPSISHNSNIIEASGILFPVSHLDTALSVMFSFSANCACVIFFFATFGNKFSNLCLIHHIFSLNNTLDCIFFTRTNSWIGEIQSLVGKRNSW